MSINVADVHGEQIRFEGMGVIDVTYVSESGNKHSTKTITVVCVGCGVDAGERDFLLFAGPYGARHRHTLRAIPVEAIKKVRKSANQSFDRHALQNAKRNINGLTPRDFTHDEDGNRYE